MARPVRNYTTILRNYINLAADKTAADISRPEAGNYEAVLNAVLEASAAGILPPDVSSDFDADLLPPDVESESDELKSHSYYN